eukprot:32019_1
MSCVGGAWKRAKTIACKAACPKAVTNPTTGSFKTIVEALEAKNVILKKKDCTDLAECRVKCDKGHDWLLDDRSKPKLLTCKFDHSVWEGDGEIGRCGPECGALEMPKHAKKTSS